MPRIAAGLPISHVAARASASLPVHSKTAAQVQLPLSWHWVGISSRGRGTDM